MGTVIIAIVYIFLCMIAGFFGRKKRLGYWGFFFCSIIFTPIISLLFMYFTAELKRSGIEEDENN